MRLGVIFAVMMLLVTATAAAQTTLDAAVLAVDSTLGTVNTGDGCPVPRTSSIYRTVQAAVNCAMPNDTLSIASGTFIENITLHQDLILRGAGSDITILDGGGGGRTVSIADNVTVTLDQLAVVNGLADLGAGVYTYAGRVTLSNVQLSGNIASLFGGGLYVYAGTARLENTMVSGNTAPVGAGVYTEIGRIAISGGQVSDAADSGIPNLITSDARAIDATVPAPSVPVIPTAEPPPSASSAAIAPATANIGAMDARLAAEWMNTFIRAVEAERFSPPVASRAYAYAAITLHEVVVPFTENMVSLSGRISLAELPQPEAGAAYDPAVAACAALEQVAESLFGNASDTTRQMFVDLRERIEAARGEVITVNVYNRSISYGEAVGAAIIEWMNADNYQAMHSVALTTTSAVQPAYWTPLEGQSPLEPLWGFLRPFTLPMGNSCDFAPDIPFDANQQSAFYFQADEVRRFVSEPTPEQQLIARYWADGAGTMTPSGHWVSIQNALVDQLDLNLAQAAEMYALTNIAMADAFISAWESKYRYNLLRPVNYIQTYIDPDWQPLLPTPPFPDYPSGHSVISGAASAVLTDLFGSVGFTDAPDASQGREPRQFGSFEAAAHEAAMSRIYAGIHFRDAVENGLAQGRCVARYTLNQLNR